MISSIQEQDPSLQQHSETQITQKETENEVKTTEIEKKSILSPVKSHDIPKQENTEQHVEDAKIIKIENVDDHVTKVQAIDNADTNLSSVVNVNTNAKDVVQGLCRGNKPAAFSMKLWVQNCMWPDVPDCNQYRCKYTGCEDPPMDCVPPMCYVPQKCAISVCNIFLQQVFAALLLMFIFTALFVGCVFFIEDLKKTFVDHGLIFLIVGIIGLLITAYTLLNWGCTRVPSCSLTDLLFATVFMSLIAAYIAITFNTLIIFLVLLVMTVIVLCCSILSFTCFDFSSGWLYLIVIFLTFTSLVLIISLGPLLLGSKFKPGTTVLIVLATLINVIIFVMQLQLLICGRSHDITDDNFAMIAFILYTSIVDLFLKFVKLLGRLDKNMGVNNNSCFVKRSCYLKDPCVVKKPCKDPCFVKDPCYLNKSCFLKDPCYPKKPCYAKDPCF